ncbi:hypothetical protein N9V74_02190 [Alteromonas sp.]|nr:hypothetical protein [Alteromonas sp.]
MSIKKLLNTCLLAIAFTPAIANSAIITSYTDRAAFIAALNGLGTIEETFDSQATNLFTSGFTLDLGDFIVSSTDVKSDNIGVVDSVPTQNLGSNQSVNGSRFFGIEGSDGGPSFNIEFDSQRFIFGFDWLDGDSTDSYAMSVLGTTFENPPFGTSTVGRGFFGIISDTAFTDVDFFQTAAGGYIGGFGIDNLLTSQIDIVTCSQDPTLPQCQSTDLPAPTTLAILGLSLCVMGWSRKSK